MKDQTFLKVNNARQLRHSMGQPGVEAGAMVRLGMHNILMSPPLVITESEVDTILSALDAGFVAA